jgi:alpha-D-ribose 1-methylphosphonate 5-triphosphate synthase subunit PhnI
MYVAVKGGEKAIAVPISSWRRSGVVTSWCRS